MTRDLIEKYLSGTLNPVQTEDLLRWIYESKSNRTYFARIKNMWISSQLDNENPNIDLDEEYKLFTYRKELNPSTAYKGFYHQPSAFFNKEIIRRAIQIAAVILFLYSIAGTYFYIKNNSVVSYTEIRTKRGEKTYILLADGTRVWLNSETLFRYPSRLDAKNVEVFLDGEAYFNVAKNPSRKFIVNASSLDITVLGTSFNVKSYSSDNTIETTLEEGKIVITGKMGEKRLEQPVMLIPNQRATFIKDIHEFEVQDIKDPTPEINEVSDNNSDSEKQVKKKPKILVTSKVDSKLYTSWKDGKLIFKSERFEDLALRMERWFDVKIEIVDAELKDAKYTGVFEKETIEQALNALSISLPFHYEIHQNMVEIRKSNI